MSIQSDKLVKLIGNIETLYQKGKSKSQIAFYTGASLAEVEKLISKNNITTAKSYTPPSDFCDLVSYTDDNAKMWARERKLIDEALSKYKSFTVLGDLHTPYQNNALLKALTNEDDNEVLIIAGDFFHLDGASTFRKGQHIPFDTELEIVLNTLTLLSKKYKKIVILMANHERRFLRLLYDKMNSHVEYADVLKGNAYLSRRIANVFNGNILETDCFWLNVGRVIIAHPDWYTKAPSKTVINTAEYFNSFGIEFDAILNAHTHKCTKIMKMNKVLVEMPCACNPQEYMNDGHRYNSEYYQGWTTVKLNKDRGTDFNNIDVHFYSDK